MPDAGMDLVGQYREKDEKTKEGETVPEKETLNNKRLRDFLDKKQVTTDNFSTIFNVELALTILREGGTTGETKMISAIENTQSYLKKIDQVGLIEETNEASFHSTLLKELLRSDEPKLENEIMEGYRAYHIVRKLAQRSIAIKKESQERREDEKDAAEKSWQDNFDEVISDIKKNFNKMSKGEKLMSVGGLIVAGILVATSKNETVKKAKDMLVGGLKLGVGAVAVNYAYKIFSGETLLEAASAWTSESVAKKGFWSDALNTTPERATAFEKGVVFLGDMDFLDLAKKYKDAKAAGKTTIEVDGVDKKDMTPEEIFTAMDAFFTKYPVDKMIKKHQKDKPAQQWTPVVSATVVEDGTVKMEGDLGSKVADGVQEGFARDWNGFFATAEGLGWMRAIYLKAWGKEPTEPELKEGAEKLKKQMQNEVAGEEELEKFLSQTFSEDHAKRFGDVLKTGGTDPNYPGVKFTEVANDSMYIVSESALDVTKAPGEGIQSMIDTALNNAQSLIRSKYPQIADNLYRYLNIEELTGVRVAKSTSFKVFLRVPVPGSLEYSRKSVLVPPTEAEKKPETPHEDIFGPDSKIEYSKLEAWDKDRLRIRFLLAEDQTEEINKICTWFTDKFRATKTSRSEVMNSLFTDDKLMEQAVLETGVQGKFRANFDLFQTKEAELAEIEANAAKDFDTTWTDKFNPLNWLKKPSDAYVPLMEQMKRNVGYKLRLAILGDASTRAAFAKVDPEKYDPEKNPDWMTALISAYKVKCGIIVKDYSAGTLRFAQ